MPLNKVEIGGDGTISVRPQGAPADAMEVVDRIKLVRLNDQSLFKDVNGLFPATDPNTQFEADASVKFSRVPLKGAT